MQQDFNLLLPAPESRDNLVLTEWLQVEGDRAKAGRERKSTFLTENVVPISGRVNATTHPQRGQKTSGKRNLFRRASLPHTLFRQEQSEHRLRLKLIMQICRCAAAPLSDPARGALPGWGFWGQSLGRRRGCWESQMTPK